MATASPTPIRSYFATNRQTASQQAYKRSLSRPQTSHNAGSQVVATSTRHQYTLNDSSDDEIPLPMKFSAETKALLNDEASIAALTPKSFPKRRDYTAKRLGAGSSDANDAQPRPEGSPKGNSPYPRRVIRLSGTPMSSTLRRSVTGSSTGKRSNEWSASKASLPLHLTTPPQATSKGQISYVEDGGGPEDFLDGLPNAPGSTSRNEDAGYESQERPSTISRPQFSASQGSVSKYGTLTAGRARFGEESALQSSQRSKRLINAPGRLMKIPARRGRRRQDDEEQSPLDYQEPALDTEIPHQGLDAEPLPDVELRTREKTSSQKRETNRASLYSSSYQGFASGSPVGSQNILDSIRRSTSPPPPTLKTSPQRDRAIPYNLSAAPKYMQPRLQTPASRLDLPSAHDKENEPPSTLKREKEVSVMPIHIDSIEKGHTRPESVDLDALHPESSSKRHPLATRSHNTPRRAAPPPPKMSILDTATSTAGASTAHSSKQGRNKMRVNGKYFTKLDCIGRGGSSRVYRVMAENSKFFALKKVSLEDADETTVRGFKGEIDLLKKLEGVERVIRLYDYELNEDKATLSVLMEMGELDMHKILELRKSAEQPKYDPSFARHYWKEMLECLEAIHEHDVVHSDLKPHNFVLVQGRLKLIDFGIANAIETDETVNVHRETQIGTPNYMSPESLIDSNAKPDAKGRISSASKLMKLGKPSDIWSLGCILYQMVYGRPPFGHILNQMQRCQAIINFNYPIEYPSLGIGNVPVGKGVIRTLKRCLNRDQHQRPSATDLLSQHDPFLNPVEYDESSIPMTEELLGRILQNAAAKCRDRVPSDMELLSLWPAGYFASLRKNAKEGRAM